MVFVKRLTKSNVFDNASKTESKIYYEQFLNVKKLCWQPNIYPEVPCSCILRVVPSDRFRNIAIAAPAYVIDRNLTKKAYVTRILTNIKRSDAWSSDWTNDVLYIISSIFRL